MTSIESASVVDARNRVSRIRTHVEDIKVLIVEAWQARDWVTLDYANWDTYCTEEFGGTIAIPKEEQGDVVFTLRESGMSTRAISSATGISKSTVNRELSTVPDGTVGPEAITGVNNKTYSPPSPRVPAESASTPEVVTEQAVPVLVDRDITVQRVIKERLVAEKERMRSVERPAILKGSRVQLPTEWMQDLVLSVVHIAESTVVDGDMKIPQGWTARKPVPRNWGPLLRFHMEHCDPLVLSELQPDLDMAISVLQEFKDALFDLCGDECIQESTS